MAQQVQLFRILTTQHREIGAVLSMLAISTDTGKRALLPVLEQQLLAHAKAEEQTFYAAVVGAGGKSAIKEIAEAKQEHRQMEAALVELRSTDLDDERWDEALQTLTELVQEHVQEEESVVFAVARQVLDRTTLQMLAQDFREQRRQVLQSLGAAEDDYDALTRDQLLQEAQRRALAATPTMTVEQLIAVLRAGY